MSVCFSISYHYCVTSNTQGMLGVSSIVWEETVVLLLFRTLQLFRFDIVICLRLIFSEEIWVQVSWNIYSYFNCTRWYRVSSSLPWCLQLLPWCLQLYMEWHVGTVIMWDGIMQTSFRELVKKVNRPYEWNEQMYIIKNSFESVKITLVLGKYF